jgi:hypothetical protein
VGGELLDPRAVGLGQPEIEPAAVGVEVGVAHGERDLLAIGRHRRFADPPHREHVVDREALRGRGRDSDREDGRKEREL